MPNSRNMPVSNFSSLINAVRNAKRKDRLSKEKELRSELCAANDKICELLQKNRAAPERGCSPLQLSLINFYLTLFSYLHIIPVFIWITRANFCCRRCVWCTDELFVAWWDAATVTILTIDIKQHNHPATEAHHYD